MLKRKSCSEARDGLPLGFPFSRLQAGEGEPLRVRAPIALTQASQGLVRSVTEGLPVGVLAGAEELARRGIGCPFDRREFTAFVTAVAERLVLGAPAGAPP